MLTLKTGSGGNRMRNVEKTMKGKTFIRNHIEKKLPPPTAARVWDRAHLELEMIYSSYRNIPPKVATHTDNFIFPAAAIYRALKKHAPEYAYEIMKTSMMEQSQKKGGVTCKDVKDPGLYKIFSEFMATGEQKDVWARIRL